MVAAAVDSQIFSLHQDTLRMAPGIALKQAP